MLNFKNPVLLVYKCNICAHYRKNFKRFMTEAKKTLTLRLSEITTLNSLIVLTPSGLSLVNLYTGETFIYIMPCELRAWPFPHSH